MSLDKGTPEIQTNNHIRVLHSKPAQQTCKRCSRTRPPASNEWPANVPWRVAAAVAARCSDYT
eukprot:366360-Chlamydomonas_euryale.AAC.8